MSEHDMTKFMTKQITVRMLEAHFNALPELLRYVIEQAKTDLAARMALNNFQVMCLRERPCLDPGEAVYGFAAMLTSLKPPITVGSSNDTTLVADLAAKFIEANKLGFPGKDWVKRLNMPDPNKKRNKLFKKNKG